MGTIRIAGEDVEYIDSTENLYPHDAKLAAEQQEEHWYARPHTMLGANFDTTGATRFLTVVLEKHSLDVRFPVTRLERLCRRQAVSDWPTEIRTAPVRYAKHGEDGTPIAWANQKESGFVRYHERQTPPELLPVDEWVSGSVVWADGTERPAAVRKREHSRVERETVVAAMNLDDRDADMELRELDRNMKQGFAQVVAVRADDGRKIRQQREAIEDMADGPDRFLAGLQGQLTKKQRELFFALIEKINDGAVRRVRTYAEIGKMLGGVKKQAIGTLVKKLYEQHEGVADFVGAIREPEKPQVFSDMSPSDRRKHGIDKTYNYDSG
jgi:hypothetical protein